MPNYHFRVRFRLPEQRFLDSEERTLRLSELPGGRAYVLDAVSGEALRESQWLLIRDVGDGFATKDEALKAGRHVKNAVMWWGAKERVGVDVGDDTTNTAVTQYAIDLLREEQGIRLLNELHGLQVYEEDPELPTRFVASNVEATLRKGIEVFKQHFCRAVDTGLELSDRETLAFDLYGLSHFESAERARFLTLVSVVESISEAKARSPEAVGHVEELIRLTRESGLPDAEIASMVGSLNWLRQESILKTCKDFVGTFLGGERYGGKPAKKFFDGCYGVRSKLVHDGKPPDGTIDFRTLVTELDRLVADLLSASAERSNG